MVIAHPQFVKSATGTQRRKSLRESTDGSQAVLGDEADDLGALPGHEEEDR